MKKIWIRTVFIIAILIIVSVIVFKVTFISRNEVKDIIINHAEIKKNDVKKWSIDLEYEDGIFIYDVNVTYNNLEYNYEINARTGDIIIYKLDV